MQFLYNIYVKPILDFLIEGLVMYQTLVGIGMIVVGSAIVIFSERITRVTAALHRRTLGIVLIEPTSHKTTSEFPQIRLLHDSNLAAIVTISKKTAATPGS